MQPHSMAVLSLVNYLWGPYVYEKEVNSASVRVIYTNQEGRFRTNIYELSDIRITKDTELKVRVIRGGGGLSCVVVARRNSPKSESEVTMTHETNHISGLRERYDLGSDSISGRHENSRKYGKFKSQSMSNERKKLKFSCEIMDLRTERFREVTYELELDPR